MRQVLYIEGINAEPWSVGKLGIGRKNGKTFPTYSKHQVLVAYQEALKEMASEAAAKTPGFAMQPPGVELELIIYIWRRRDQYTSATGRTVTRNSADATNVQKATEDALQGVLYPNDNQCRRVTCEIVQEGRDVEPRIIVICQPRGLDYIALAWEGLMASKKSNEGVALEVSDVR